MDKKKSIILFICFSTLTFSQNEEFNNLLLKEINEQIFDSDNFYPKTAIEINRQFEKIHGKPKKETIIYSDGVKKINLYNRQGSLTQLREFKNSKLKYVFNFIYEADGTTPLKQTGIYDLDYTVLKKDKYTTKYYATKSLGKKQGSTYRYLDTLFIEDSKYKYEYIKQSNSEYSLTKEFKYIYEYGLNKSLERVRVFENNIKIGHAKNFYNNKGQVIKHELFWDYNWFVEDTGFPSIRNTVSNIKYTNGLITSIEKQGYYPETLEWKKSTINYDCKLKKENKVTVVTCSCDNGDKIEVLIDSKGNWINKIISKNNKIEVTKRDLEYYD